MREFNIILPGEDTMNGFFAYYKKKDGKYKSRYFIRPTYYEGEISNSYSYYDTKSTDFFTVYNYTIRFSNLFVITNYSFALSDDHSIPISWSLYGKDKKGLNIKVDEKQSQCIVQKVTTFVVDNPDAYREYVFYFHNNTVNKPYACLRSFEIFGIQYSMNHIVSFGCRKKIISHLLTFCILLT